MQKQVMRQGQKQVDLFQENGKVVKGGEAESSRSCLRKMVRLENIEKGSTKTVGLQQMVGGFSLCKSGCWSSGVFDCVVALFLFCLFNKYKKSFQMSFVKNI